MIGLLLSWLPLLGAPPDTWAGYQEVVGSRDIPVVGTVETRTRTWFLATRHPSPDGGFRLVQRACHVDFAPVLGVQVRMDPKAVPKLPSASARLSPLADGSFGGTWTSGWGAEDLDGDGRPGVEITVEAPLCGGSLSVASATTTKARLRRTGDVLEARLAVRVQQTILGAHGACLKATAEDSEERLTGWFRAVRVPKAARCDDWRPEAWPAMRASAPTGR